MNLAQRLAVALVERYQDNGGGKEAFRVDCNFEPSCSEYACQAIRRYGAGRGCLMALSRIRRCNQRDLVDKICDPLPLE